MRLRAGQVDPESLQQRVRKYCGDLIGRGTRPTKDHMLAAFPDSRPETLFTYMFRSLADLRWSWPCGPEIHGETPEEQAEVEAAVARLRTEKEARGERPRGAAGAWIPPTSRDPRTPRRPRP